jgi:hypothetical protein
VTLAVDTVSWATRAMPALGDVQCDDEDEGPPSYDQAMVVLENNAAVSVETEMGPLPEPSSSRLTRRSVRGGSIGPLGRGPPRCSTSGGSIGNRPAPLQLSGSSQGYMGRWGGGVGAIPVPVTARLADEGVSVSIAGLDSQVCHFSRLSFRLRLTHLCLNFRLSAMLAPSARRCWLRSKRPWRPGLFHPEETTRPPSSARPPLSERSSSC